MEFCASSLDTNIVTSLSSFHGPLTISKNKRKKGVVGGLDREMPVAIEDYRQGMGNVDRNDQHLSYYGFQRRAYKWWHPIFFYLIDCVIVNCWIITKEYCRKNKLKEPPQKDFRENLIQALKSAGGSTSRKHTPTPTRQPPSTLSYTFRTAIQDHLHLWL